MNLKEYLNLHMMPPIEFAHRSGVEITTIRRALYGVKIGLKNAKKIFEETGGAVKLETLLTGIKQKYRPLK